MKRGTPGHPKTLALAAALELPQWGAVGLLEMLWHFAAQYARRGDVGRYADAALASALGWKGDPGRLVQALVDSGWLDPCRCHRLRIHDWPEHADQAVQRTEDVRRRGWLECYREVPPLRGAAFAHEPQEETPLLAPPAAVEAADQSAASSLLETSSGALEVSSLPLPLPVPVPVPEPTDPPLTPPNGGGAAESPPAADVRRPGTNGQGAGGAPGRRERARQLRDDADAAERYWIELGGRPGREDRRRIREALRSGFTLPQLQGSIAERVRDALLQTGQLRDGDAWPPPGRAPYDPGAPARAAPT